MTACLRCPAEADGLFCPDCEFAVRESEGETMARLVPEPGAVAYGTEPDVRGHAAWRKDGWGGVSPGLCHCPLGEAHRAEVSR